MPFSILTNFLLLLLSVPQSVSGGGPTYLPATLSHVVRASVSGGGPT